MTVTTAHVGRSSGDYEWYTPPPIIEAARRVMGGIDLDPASVAEANQVVQATTFYSEPDGLDLPWYGRVWLNPPYARDLISQFADKLVRALYSVQYIDPDPPPGEGGLKCIEQAIVLVNNATETAWGQHAAAPCEDRLFPGQTRSLLATRRYVSKDAAAGADDPRIPCRRQPLP